MATVQRWSGVEVRALREAKRMSLREFAGHLGVSERMISKWEAGGENIWPRPVNQAALDTSLMRSDPDTQARFAYLTADSLVPEAQLETFTEPIGSGQVRHPNDGTLMVKVEGNVFLSGPSNEPIWVPAYYIDVYPTSNAEYGRFVAATEHPAPQHWKDDAPPEDTLNHPVVFTTWNDAVAYASWAGKELPTSQQWEKAARGTRGTVYPGAISRRQQSATSARTALAQQPLLTVTKAASVPTAFMTSAAMFGNGVRPRHARDVTN